MRFAHTLIYFVWNLLRLPRHLFFWRRLSARRSRYFHLALGALLVVLIPLALASFRNPEKAQAAWYDDNWMYRKSVAITAHTAAENNVYISLTLDTATLITNGQLQSDCGDLRYTQYDGKLLQYYLSSCNNAASTIHVLFPTFPAGAQTIYYYYGNPSVANGFSASDFPTEATSYTVGSTGSEEKTPGPIAYWRFDEGTGTTTSDATQGGATATLAGATTPTWQTEDQCVAGKCLSFNGSTGNLTVSRAISNVQTVSMWVRPVAVTASALLDLDGGTHKITVSSGTISATGFSSPTIYVNGQVSSTLTANQWQHVEVTTATGFATTSSQTIGKSSTTFFQGFIDEVKLYPYARSAAQVKTDYTAGLAGAGAVKGTSVALGGASDKFLSDGLVGYWKMDESSGNASDSSGNGNTGTNTNTASFVAGKFGNATQLAAASNQYFAKSSNSTLQVSSGSFTLAGWLYLDSKSADRYIIWKGGNAGSNTEYGIRYVQNVGLRLSFLDGETVSSVTATNFGDLSTSTWYFVAAWYNSAEKMAFISVNGTTPNSQAVTGSLLASTHQLEIGARVDINGYMDGKLDEVRIYNRALSPAEVKAVYEWAPGPVGYWKFDENTGTSVADSSGNGNTGTWQGTLGSQWTVGKYGAAGNFNGSDKYISASAISSTSGTSARSLSVWFKTLTDQNQPLWDSGTTGSLGASFQLFQSSSVGGTGAPSAANQKGIYVAFWGRDVLIPKTIYDGQWHHVAFTLNGTTVYVYIDGVAPSGYVWDGTSWSSLTSAPFTLTAAPNTTNNPVLIGNTRLALWSSGSSYFNGQIDDARVYNYARTQKQIVEDMNAGHPPVGSPVGSAVGHWKFDEGYGTTANDNSINANTLTLSSASWTNSGKFNKAFNGTGAVWLSRADDADFDFAATDDLAISVWFKADSATNPSATEYIVAKGPTPSAGYALYATASGTICAGIDDDATWTPDDSACTTSDIYDGTWHHLVMTKTGTSRLDLYVDGSLSASDTSIAATGSLANAASLYVADVDGVDNGSELNGDVDELKIYPYALTADEVKTDYNRGAAQVLGSLSDNSSYQPSAANQEYCVPGDTSTCTAPVGRWDFEENQGTSARDTSGNNLTGTLTNSPKWTSGKIGSGVIVNSTDQSYITMGNINKTIYTLSVWFKPQTTVSTSASGGLDNFIVFIDGSGHNADIWLQGGPATASCTDEVMGIMDTLNGYRTCSSSITSITPVWNHFVMVWNASSSNYDMYLNGKLQTVTKGTAASHVGLITASAFKIGQRGALPEFADSWGNFTIDQLRIYDYSRSAAQIAWEYSRGAPVGHWKFDECQGTQTYDSSGNNNHGTITPGSGGQTAVGTCTGSAGTLWADGVNGKFNSSLDFDGTDDYVSIGNVSVLGFDRLNPFSFSFWIKTTNTSTEITLDKFASNVGYSLSINNVVTGGWFFTMRNTAGTNELQVRSSNSGVTDGNWHHVVLTYTGSSSTSGVTMYVDGKNITLTTQTDNLTSSITNSANFAIGARDSGVVAPFNGQIDDVRIYNYALTPTQVKLLYNGNAAYRVAPLTGTP